MLFYTIQCDTILYYVIIILCSILCVEEYVCMYLEFKIIVHIVHMVHSAYALRLLRFMDE